MYLLILGLVLLVMKWQGWSLVAEWPWWMVLAPFPLTVVWWYLADLFGYTKRKATQRSLRETKRKTMRRAELLETQKRLERRIKALNEKSRR
jgi:small Trp-rich protein